MTEKWKKTNEISKRGDFDVKSINARPYIQCARVTLNRLSIFLGLTDRETIRDTQTERDIKHRDVNTNTADIVRHPDSQTEAEQN